MQSINQHPTPLPKPSLQMKKLIFATHNDPITAGQYPQNRLNDMDAWCSIWKVKVNNGNCSRITFTLKIDTVLPMPFSTKFHLRPPMSVICDWYLELTRRRKYTFIERQTWMPSSSSRQTLQTYPKNKLHSYEILLKRIWYHGIQLWGVANK